jgi:hypothetical protein
MLQRFLRSPFIPMTMFVLLIAFVYVVQLDLQADERWRGRFFFLLFIGVWLFWTVLIAIHNRKYPASRINYWGFIPCEFRELDEGQQWVTFKACRNVYIYYTTALPVAAAVSSWFSQYRFSALFFIGALGLGQYIVYWLTIRRLNQL